MGSDRALIEFARIGLTQEIKRLQKLLDALPPSAPDGAKTKTRAAEIKKEKQGQKGEGRKVGSNAAIRAKKPRTKSEAAGKTAAGKRRKK